MTDNSHSRRNSLRKVEIFREQIDEWDCEFINKVSFEISFHLINAGVLLELRRL